MSMAKLSQEINPASQISTAYLRIAKRLQASITEFLKATIKMALFRYNGYVSGCNESAELQLSLEDRIPNFQDMVE